MGSLQGTTGPEKPAICSFIFHPAILQLRGPGALSCCEYGAIERDPQPIAEHPDNSTNSVLPPPPRYPVQNGFNSNATNGLVLPMVETINTLGHPSGPEYQLVVGEGKYPKILEESASDGDY